MAVPERYGGAGAEDFRLNLVIGEECQRAGVGSFGLGITLHNDICLPYFLTYCNEPQRERWLAGIASGELITALAMTEPGIGSDLAAMSTSARREGDHYVVNGSKTFITNGINADLVITRRQDRSVRAPPRHQPDGRRARHGGLRARAQPREDRPARAGHRRAVLLRRARAGRQPARTGGRGLSLPRLQPAPGAPVDRRLRRRRRRGGARLDARVRARAPGVRPGDRLLPELALHARRAARRNRRSRARSSTAARRRSTPASSPPRTPRPPSGGAPTCRAASSTAACSCSAATATCSSTRSPARSPTRA